jgi:hypothetical protein
MVVFLRDVRTVESSRVVQMLIDQVATDISLQSCELGTCHLRLFLQWLKRHSSVVRKSEGNLLVVQASDNVGTCDVLKKVLLMWFASLLESGWFWKYQLLLMEIH